MESKFYLIYGGLRNRTFSFQYSQLDCLKGLAWYQLNRLIYPIVLMTYAVSIIVLKSCYFITSQSPDLSEQLSP